MNKLKTIVFFFIVISSLLSCEKDEICLEDNTPLLIIRFYNAENPDDLKKVPQLKVQIEGIEGNYENSTITVLTDSIAIPIKVTEDITKFRLTLNGNDEDLDNDNEDSLILNYIMEDEYVSRPCGYKTLYYDVKTNLMEDDDNWIIYVEALADPLNILNEKEAHVKIYH